MHHQFLPGMWGGRECFLPLQILGEFTLLFMELLYYYWRPVVHYFSNNVIFNLIFFILWFVRLVGETWEVCWVGFLPVGSRQTELRTYGSWPFIYHQIIND